MSVKTKSIIEELENFVPSKNKDKILEQRASHVIISTINVLDLLKEHYSKEDYEDIQKKIFLSIKNRDITKFSKKIKCINEGKKPRET